MFSIRSFMLAFAVVALLAPALRARAHQPESFATEETADDCCHLGREITLAVGVPCLDPGWEFNAGFLYLRPGANNMGWAVLTTEENFNSPVPIATPLWNIETFEPGYQPGFEIGAAYQCAAGSDMQVGWQHLRTGTADAAAVDQATGQWISPFSQTGPPTAETQQEMVTNTGVNDLLSAEGRINFEYDSINLDFGQYLQVGGLTLRLFAGLGCARLQQQVFSTFFGEPDPGAPFPANVQRVISLDNTSTFAGVGPRFGFDTEYETRHGFRFVGQVAGTALVGQTQPAEYLFAATSPELAAAGIALNQEGIFSNSVTHVVYSGSAKLGIGYTWWLPSGAKLSLDAGYLAALYVNPFWGYETNENVIALQVGSLSTGSMKQTLSNFSLDGLYFNAGLTW